MNIEKPVGCCDVMGFFSKAKEPMESKEFIKCQNQFGELYAKFSEVRSDLEELRQSIKLLDNLLSSLRGKVYQTKQIQDKEEKDAEDLKPFTPKYI